MPAPKGHPPYPGSETGGRPVEWTPYCIEHLRLQLEEWMTETQNFWLSDFTFEMGLDRNVLARLAKKDERFMSTYKRAVQLQESKLMKGGLFNVTNCSMAIFTLKCNHGWSEGTNRMGVQDDEVESKSSRQIANIKDVAIDHANSLEQASD